MEDWILQWIPSASEFLKQHLEFLCTDEVVYGLPIGIAQGVAAGRKWGEAKPLFAQVTHAGKLAGLLLQTPPRAMHLMPNHPEMLGFLAEEMQAQGLRPGRIQARESEARSFADDWCARTQQTWKPGMNSCVHRLDSVQVPKRETRGQMRPGRAEESDFLCQWAYRFAVDCHMEADAAEGVPERLHHLDDGRLFVWEVDGEPVSMAAITRESPNGRTISLVYTPDGERCNGYASHLVAALSQYILDSGKSFCTLFTDKANPTSNKIYSEIGYHPVADFLEANFEPA